MAPGVQIVARTDLVSANVIQPTPEEFITSDAAPWDDGDGSAEVGGLCRDVHAEVVDAVFASLTPAERARLVYGPEDVVLDLDYLSWGGPDWTTPLPPQVAWVGLDGKLHLQAKAMIVPRVFPVPIVPTPKAGRALLPPGRAGPPPRTRHGRRRPGRRRLTPTRRRQHLL